MNDDHTSLEMRLLTLLHLAREEHDEIARAELNALLLENAEARRLMPRLLVDEQALVSQLRDESIAAIIEPTALFNEALPRRDTGRWYSWRPIAAAAAGIVFGMFCTSVVFGYVLPRTMERVATVFIEGFESGMTKTAPGLPCEAGRWSGDEAEVVNSTLAMKARSGGKMLRFLSATYPGENSPRSQWGDVYRLVDVRGLASAGRTMARLSVSFAQETLSSEERFAGRAEALAIDKELSALPMPLTLAWLQQNNSAMGSRRAVLTAARSWQDVSVEVPITPETRYVMLHLALVQEQPTIQSGAVQFPGHFMDDVRLEIASHL